MLFYNLKTSLRQVRKNKAFSLINISGLVIGMISFLLIFQYVKFEKSYDNFHENKENIYRVYHNIYNGNEFVQKRLGCPSALMPALKENFPEIENSARLLRCVRMVIANESLHASFRSDDVYFADSSFMSMFSFPIHKGQSSNLLVSPNTAVITHTYAKKTFGDENPVGKSLHFQSRYFDFRCIISAVLKDIPENSHIKIDALVSMATYLQQKLAYGKLNDWKSRSYFSYLHLKEDANPLALEKKLPPFIEKSTGETPDRMHSNYTMENIGDVHLNTEPIAQYEEATISKQVLYLLLGIAFIIMFIAWVNYINLSTANALDRAKEIGIRKVSGANRKSLIWQFYFETFIYNGIALILALGIIVSSSTVINNLLGRQIDFNVFNDSKSILAVILLFIGGIIISGTYPAFVLSSYEPKEVLKGKFKGKSTSFDLRKGLVVFQFAASIFLIASVLAIISQVNYLRNTDVGINAKQLLVVRAPVLSSDSLFQMKMERLKQEVKQYPEYKSMAGSYYIPGKEIRWTMELHKSKNDNNPTTFKYLLGDIDFIPSMGFKMICGRTFEQNKTDKNNIILTETGVKELGFNTPESILNQTIYMHNQPRNVIGVIADYHHKSAKLNFESTCIGLSNQTLNYYSIQMQAETHASSLALLKKLWNNTFPDDPFDYFFLNEYMDKEYKTDITFGQVFSFFTCVAIFIACLGLLGLSYHSTHIRTKEIGIRKTLGSTVQSIMLLLFKDTMWLIIISSVIALPCAGFFISSWLNNYANKIEIGWWFFLLPVISLLIIAFGTVSFHVIKTAHLNPVKSLRDE